MKAGQILTKETENFRFRRTILPPILTGECLTITFVPHGGRKRSLVYLSQNAQKFGFQKLGQYQVYYLDNDELTGDAPEDYYLLFLRSLRVRQIPEKIRNKEDLFSLLKNKVTSLVQQGWHLIFILGHFDQLDFPTYFYNNLKSIQEVDKTKVHFIFAIAKDIFEQENLMRYGQLREVICQNLFYFPLLNARDAKFAARTLNQKYGYRLASKKQQLAAQISGGHPSLIKACLKVISDYPRLNSKELPKILSQQLEIKIILNDILKNLSEKEKDCLKSVALKKQLKPQEIPERLLKLNLVLSLPKNNFKLFSPLIEPLFTERKSDEQKVIFDYQAGEILINGSPPREELSLQEFHLLSSFLKKPNVIFSRDQIAEVLWGKKSFEKYSDWAIDQAVSQLRKSLEKIGGSTKNLQTIRGRGYRWVG